MGTVASRLLCPSELTLLLAAAALAVADAGDRLTSSAGLASAPLDETAHLLTTLLLLWALGNGQLGVSVRRRVMVPALVASVAIDLDHVPGLLGAHWLTAGTPRPYVHSLTTICVVLALATLWPRRRSLLLGIAVGFTIHLWRDLCESSSGVSLLWPLSDRALHFSHLSYVLAMAAVVVLDAVLLVRRRIPATAAA